MALFGFAINFNSGATSYALVSGENETAAEAEMCARDLKDRKDIESIVHYDAETIVQEQYDGLVVLSNYEWAS